MTPILDLLGKVGRKTELARLFGVLQPDDVVARAIALDDCLELGWLGKDGPRHVTRTSAGWAVAENGMEPLLREAGIPLRPIRADWLWRHHSKSNVVPELQTDRHRQILGMHVSGLRLKPVKTEVRNARADRIVCDGMAATLFRGIQPGAGEWVLTLSVADAAMKKGAKALAGEYLSVAAVLAETDVARMERRLAWVAPEDRPRVRIAFDGEDEFTAALRDRMARVPPQEEMSAGVPAQ